MKPLTLFFLFISIATFSQNFDTVDAKVVNYPRFNKVEDLADKIDEDFKNDADKARAAFFWLAKNIRYNLKEYYSPGKRSYRFKFSSEEDRVLKIQAIKDKFIAEAFKNKMGVCEEYAQSFKKICDLLNIEAAVIKGNVRSDAREIGTASNTTNHAWNAVKIDGKWKILDATWAAGYEYDGKWVRKFNNYFFNIPTNKIFKTHYPKEAIWVLPFGRMTLQEFYNQPIYTNTFLALEAELITPKSGFIILKKNEDIVLKLKNLDSNSQIIYGITGSKYAQKPLITIKDDIATLSIKNPNRNADLTLYINNEDALHFKIKVE